MLIYELFPTDRHGIPRQYLPPFTQERSIVKEGYDSDSWTRLYWPRWWGSKVRDVIFHLNSSHILVSDMLYSCRIRFLLVKTSRLCLQKEQNQRRIPCSSWMTKMYPKQKRSESLSRLLVPMVLLWKRRRVQRSFAINPGGPLKMKFTKLPQHDWSNTKRSYETNCKRRAYGAFWKEVQELELAKERRGKSSRASKVKLRYRQMWTGLESVLLCRTWAISENST